MKTFDLGFLDKPSEGKVIPVLYKFLVIILFAYIFQAAFVRSMYNYTDHDDNPYIAGAKITHEEGLLPYKDYRLIHMPYYVFAYSAILKLTPSLTFTARIISLASFLSVLALIFFSLQRSLAGKNQIFRFIVGASALIFLMYNPFVQYAFGRFTYDFPLLLTTLSFLTLISIEQGKKAVLKAALSGLLLGVAIGFRMHFIMFSVPFAFSILLFLKQPKLTKWKLFMYFSIGGFLGLIPVFILFLNAPGEFLFDIYQFHFKIDMKVQPGAALPFGEKLSNFLSMIRDKWQSSILLEGAVIVLVLKLFGLIRDDFRIKVLLLSVPFLVYLSVGKLLMIQYLYPLSVFMILLIFYGISGLKKHNSYAAILSFCLSILILSGVNYKKLVEIKNTENWYALSRNKISALVEEAISGKARILTLSPAEIIESNSVTIYKEFVSSPFLYRTSHSIPDDVRKKLNIISGKELGNFMDKNQPDAILTGYYPGDLEIRFIDFAQNNGYTKVDLPTERNLKLYIKKTHSNEL